STPTWRGARWTPGPPPQRTWPASPGRGDAGPRRRTAGCRFCTARSGASRELTRGTAPANSARAGLSCRPGAPCPRGTTRHRRAGNQWSRAGYPTRQRRDHSGPDTPVRRVVFRDTAGQVVALASCCDSKYLGGHRPKEASVPAVTVDDVLVLPRVPALDPARTSFRGVQRIVTAPSGLEGEGFPVRRAFAGVPLTELDPFIHLDQMGEVEYAPGERKGTPWHPHRGFETVTYMIDGVFEHQDSHGGGGTITNGDTQWMTAGAGILHIEAP